MNISKTLKCTSLILLLLVAQLATSQDQDNLPYSKTVTDNPTADRDLQLMADYSNALVNNDMVKAEGLLTDNFANHGPSANETQNKKETIALWKNAHTARTNQKVEFVMTTFKVLQGDLKGVWVSQWGTYTFTQMKKNIVLPYHCTARIANGKIKETRFYFDNMSLAVTLGFTITPPQQD
jgi:ketosteroid isomerase-like protein